MHVILKQIGGTASVLLRHGQRITIGRTKWADHSFPHDSELEPVHFSVECAASGATVLSVADAPLLLDGQETKEAALFNGQTIQAGNTSFLVVIDDPGGVGQVSEAAAGEPAADAESDQIAADEAIDGWVSAAATIEVLAIEPIDDICDAPPSTAVEMAQLLAANNRHGDAIQVLAWSLPRPQAVAWAADCVESRLAEALTEDEQNAIRVARDWSADQSDAHGNMAGEAAETVGLDSAAGWVAQAAFWSGNNLSPPGLPEVKPPPTLTSAAVKGAIVALAFAARPDAPDSVMNECLLTGYQAGDA